MTSAPSKEYALAMLRVVSLRLKQIDADVTATGIGLSGNLIDVETALRWVEEVAPGCLDVVKTSILDRAAQ